MEIVDTNKLREDSRSLVELTKELNEEINSLYLRISNMGTRTLEWVGSSSENFIRRSNIEKVQYVKMINSLTKYAKFLEIVANEYDSLINKVR